MIKITKEEYEMIKKVDRLIDTDYLDEINEEMYIDNNSIMSLIEDLVGCVEECNNNYKELKDDLINNYKPIDIDLGIYDHDFI